MCAHIWNYTNTLIQCCILLQWQRLGPPLFTVEQRPIALELLAKDLPPNTQTHTYLFPHYTVTSCTAYLPVPKMTSPLIYTLCLYKKKCSHSYRFSCQPRNFQNLDALRLVISFVSVTALDDNAYIRYKVCTHRPKKKKKLNFLVRIWKGLKDNQIKNHLSTANSSGRGGEV